MAAPTTPSPEPGVAPTGVAQLGPRAQRRAAPRLTIALAAAGCALVVFGALIVGGDGLAGSDGDGSQLPGILLSAGTVVGGFVLLARQRSGPLGTAGAVAATFGVPPLLFFLTFDEGSFPPYSTEGILFLSTAAWAFSYVVGPGRGRPLFLGAACLGLWASILQATERLLDLPFDLLNGLSAGFEGNTSGGFTPPDPTTIGGLSLAFAAAYLLLARRWDRQGFEGAATPLTVAALWILPVGIGALTDELEVVGTGLLTMAIGTAVAAHGASVGRRATTWLGAAGAAFGVLLVVGEIADEPTPGGLALMAAGVTVIVAAEAIRQGTDEPDELVVTQDEPAAF